MTDEKLRPATDDELIQSLPFALRFSGRRRVDATGPLIAQIAAERLLQHLKQSGYVVMKGPGAASPKAPDYGKPWR